MTSRKQGLHASLPENDLPPHSANQKWFFYLHVIIKVGSEPPHHAWHHFEWSLNPALIYMAIYMAIQLVYLQWGSEWWQPKNWYLWIMDFSMPGSVNTQHICWAFSCPVSRIKSGHQINFSSIHMSWKPDIFVCDSCHDLNNGHICMILRYHLNTRKI